MQTAYHGWEGCIGRQESCMGRQKAWVARNVIQGHSTLMSPMQWRRGVYWLLDDHTCFCDSQTMQVNGVMLSAGRTEEKLNQQHLLVKVIPSPTYHFSLTISLAAPNDRCLCSSHSARACANMQSDMGFPGKNIQHGTFSA